MNSTTTDNTSLDSTQRANLDATRNELDSLLERDSLIDIVKIGHASLADVEPRREIALTPSKCLPRSNSDHYTTNPGSNRPKLTPIESRRQDAHLQTFTFLVRQTRRAASTNPRTIRGYPNPRNLYGSCTIMSMYCKVLIDKPFVWILHCKIRVNGGVLGGQCGGQQNHRTCDGA